MFLSYLYHKILERASIFHLFGYLCRFDPHRCSPGKVADEHLKGWDGRIAYVTSTRLSDKRLDVLPAEPPVAAELHRLKLTRARERVDVVRVDVQDGGNVSRLQQRFGIGERLVRTHRPQFAL